MRDVIVWEVETALRKNGIENSNCDTLHVKGRLKIVF